MTLRPIDVEGFRWLCHKRGTRVEIAWHQAAPHDYFEVWLVERRTRHQLTTFRGRPRRFRHSSTVLRFLDVCGVNKATLVFRK